MDNSRWFRALIILAVIAVGLYVAGELWDLAVHFSDLIILFFLSWLLAFVLTPTVSGLRRIVPLSPVGAALLIYLVLLVCLIMAVILVIPLAIDQLGQLVARLPGVANRVPLWLALAQAQLDAHNLPVDLRAATTGMDLMTQVNRFGTEILTNTISLASGVASTALRVVLIFILSFYFVLDGERIAEGTIDLVSERFRSDVRAFYDSINRSFGGFLRGTAIQAVILGAGTGAIMLAGGLPYVLLVSMFAALVMVIPFVGPVLALVPPVLIALFTPMTVLHLAFVIVALLILQIIVMNVIAPKVMADSVGLHPLLVFLALLLGAKQAGLAGAIFGVPIAAVIQATAFILLRRLEVIPPPKPRSAHAVNPNSPQESVVHRPLALFLGRLFASSRTSEHE